MKRIFYKIQKTKYQKRKSVKLIQALIIAITAWIIPVEVHAASCCGGGSSTSLILPKFSKSMVSFSAGSEIYHGSYDVEGFHNPDPPQSDLKQYKTTIGGAIRLSDRFQLALSIPYVWNSIQYSGVSSTSNGLGDSSLNLTYETFDNVRCVWKVRDFSDLIPAIYFGVGFLLPTGNSQYSSIKDNFHITGRGFYRGDLKLLIDKSIYAFNISLGATYGKHFTRPVNREYGEYITPYTKQLGDRLVLNAAMGYTFNLDIVNLTLTGAYSRVEEFAGKIGGKSNPFTAFTKNVLSFTTSVATADKNKVLKFTISHSPEKDYWGTNTAATNTFSIEVWNVIR
ncbi:MAG: transporter [Leptospirales bacterium]